MKINKVLLMRPPLLYDSRIGHEQPHPPIELLYLAASIQDEYSVALLDGMAEIRRVEKFDNYFRRAGISDSGIKKIILELSPEVVCLGSMWVNQKSMLEHVACCIKSLNPQIITIAGGLLASSIPEVISQNKNIDYVVVGEGERVLPLLLERIAKEKKEPLPGVVFKNNGRFTYLPPSVIEPLDGLPMPAYHMLDFSYYKTAFELGHIKSIPFIGLLPTRGCTYGCTFCSLPNVTGRTFRHHSVERVITELKYLKGNYGVKEIHFYDANLLENPEFAKSLFRAMIENKINIPWVPEAGLSIWELSDEVMELAVESGMYRIDLPIESGSRWVRKEIMQKDFFDNGQISRIIKKCRSLGVERIYGYIMLGNPGEDIKTMQESLDLLNELDLDYKGVRFACPFPKTKFYDICKKRGYLIKDFSYSDLWFQNPAIRTENFSAIYLNVLFQADRALALKRLKVQGLLKSIKDIFKKWGFLVGVRSVLEALRLYFHYKSLHKDEN